MSMLNLINVRKSFYRSFRSIFFVSAGLFLTVLIVMIDREKAIRTDHAPRGIVSLELTSKKINADSIRNEWTKDSVRRGQATCNCKDTAIARHVYTERDRIKRARKDIALNNIRLDYLFIVAYGLFLVTILLRNDIFKKGDAFLKPDASSLSPVKAATWFLLGGVLIAMVLDGIENVAMTNFLHGSGSSYPLSFFIPAIVKFVLLSIVSIYLIIQLFIKQAIPKFLQTLSSTVENIFAVIWNYRLVIVGLLLVYFVMWLLDQGQDLLLNINTKRRGPVVFYISITSLAFLNWHLPKYLTYYKPDEKTGLRLKDLFRNVFRHDNHHYQNTSRLIGTLTFVIPAFGILNALDKFKVPYFFDFLSPFTLLLLLHLLYMILLKNRIIERVYASLGQRYKSPVVIGIFIISLGIVTWFGLDQNNRHPSFLANLSLGLVILSFLFLLYTTLRKTWMIQFVRESKRNNNISWFYMFDEFLPILLMSTALFLATFFLLINFFPLSTTILGRYSTLPVIISGVIFYIVFFAWLIFTGRRYRINLAGTVLAVSVLMALLVNNRFHDVRTLKITEPNTTASLDRYFKLWLLQRRDEIDSCTQNNEKYPVFLVNTYGGGIRAAAWTSMQVAYLDSVMLASSRRPLQHYMFSYSGASGGTIGAAVLCAFRHQSVDPQTYSIYRLKELYRHDFLTPVLIGLQGRDIFLSTTGISSSKDRAALQETVWEDHLQEMGIPFDQPYNSLWDTVGNNFEVPLLLSNTYNINLGLKGIVSPVKLRQRDFPGTIFVSELAKDQTLRLSTGAFLSARFPFLSPAGRFENNYHFIDGGLKENSGAETSLEVHNAIVQSMSSPVVDSVDILARNLFNNVRFYFLSINNMIGVFDPAVDQRNIFEFTAPLTALINNYRGASERADQILRDKVPSSYFTLKPVNNYLCEDSTRGFQPILPLGWQISDQALQRIQESIFYHNRNSQDMLRRVFRIEP
ncbi:MAG TPA: hypothetical protein VKA49_01105 [Flavitalea sp.]|nr:hypothetical protein [Flavitalea sp.]